MNWQAVGLGAGVDEHDHLDAALPPMQEVVEAVLDQQREPEDQQRHGGCDDRRHREGDVAFEAGPGLPERVRQSESTVDAADHS